jgi:hypothetical protein
MKTNQNNNQSTLMSAMYDTYITNGFWKSMQPYKLKDILRKMIDYYQSKPGYGTKVNTIREVEAKLDEKINSFNATQRRVAQLTY